MPKPFPDNPPNCAYGTTPGTEENPIVVEIEEPEPEAEAATDAEIQADAEDSSVTEPTPDRHSPVEDTASATTLPATRSPVGRGAARSQ